MAAPATQAQAVDMLLSISDVRGQGLFFWLASGTVGFSPRFKNVGHVITFLAALRFAKH